MKSPTPFSLVFLAGGTGMRMGTAVPKQYLLLHHKPLALYSFEVFTSMPEVKEVVVVCEKQYAFLFFPYQEAKGIKLLFASPGPRRQDSVLNGIQSLKGNPLVCIHDSARPLIEMKMIRSAVEAAESWGAAAIGVKVKATIKVCNDAQIVVETPLRGALWEVQTPQVIRLDLLKEGFQYAQEHRLIVTDDTSLVELLGKPVKIIEGSYANIKVTTPEDLMCIEKLLEQHVLL